MKISSLHRAGLVTASAILAASLAACQKPAEPTSLGLPFRRIPARSVFVA